MMEEDRGFSDRKWLRGPALLCYSIVFSTLMGCSRSPVVEYYTLIPDVVEEQSPAKTKAQRTLQVVLPTLPALVDRAEFTEIETQNRVTVHENIRWAVDLRKIVRDYFIVHLKHAIPQLDVISSATKIVSRDSHKLVVVFDRFDVYAGRYVDLSMSWRISDAAKARQQNRQEISVQQTIEGEQASQAIDAIRLALGAIAERISAEIATRY